MAIIINGSGTVTGLSVGGLPDGTVDAGTLATDSVTAVKIPDTVEASLKSGRRNLIINGDFKVSQRGDYTSVTQLVDSELYMLDRWVTRESAVSGTLQDLGGKIRLEATSTGTGQVRVVQHIETQDLVLGGTYTFSALVKSNSSTAGLGIFDDETSGSGDTDTYYVRHTGDGTEQRLSVTFTVRTTEPYYFSARMALEPSGNGSITTGDYIEIAEVQLELGSVATEFEHRSYGEELALCQRYYEVLQETLRGSTGGGGNDGLVNWFYKVQKRVTPTVTASIYATVSRNNSDFYSVQRSGGYMPQINSGATSDAEL